MGKQEQPISKLAHFMTNNDHEAPRKKDVLP